MFDWIVEADIVRLRRQFDEASSQSERNTLRILLNEKIRQFDALRQHSLSPVPL